MKFWLYPLFILLVCNTTAQAQKYDNQWMIGYGGLTNTDSLYSVNNLDFSSLHPIVSNKFRNISLQWGAGNICNSEGVLQFYTNGLEIHRANDYMMPNGNGLNPGIVADQGVSDGYY